MEKFEKPRKTKADIGKKRGFIKGLKQVIVYVGTQRTVVILLLLAQVMLLLNMFIGIERNYAKAQIIFQALASITAVYIINRRTKAEFKIGWLVPLVAFPLFTVVIYFILSNQYGTRLIRNAYAEKCRDTKKYLAQDETTIENLKAESEEVYRYACYMNNYAGYPIHQNTEVTYYRSGEEKFEVMKEELKKARHYIFIEMFIVDQGSVWDEILEILLKKVEEGVEVRFIYDGMGSQQLLPFNYDKWLNEHGIKTIVYMPFIAMLSSIQNNRDHRKIIVIDGHTGFTGGDNMADEYVNRIVRFGYWKDTAVMLKGEGVWNLTMMFLQMWEVLSPKEEKLSDYNRYRPSRHRIANYTEKGFVLPFSDSPLDNENVGELTYLNILSSSKDYCYITTPYLILNDELTTALTFAAKKGVDVKIIVPGIPDKWYVKMMALAHYPGLLEAGVKIYEYDGFIHAKTFVSDDCKAVVGTVNLDYRSLYLHFEDACFLYKMPAVADVKSDFQYMLKEKVREVTLDDCNNRSAGSKLVSALLKIMEPLL